MLKGEGRASPPVKALLAVLATAFLVAGCAGQADPPAADALGPDDGLEASGPVTSIAAPRWEAGQWWEWETTFTDGTRPETFCSIVLSPGTENVLVTERDGMAKEGAAFGHPLLAPVRASDLAMGGWGDAPFALLSFPLTDGKTWTSSIPNVAWDVFYPSTTVDAAFTATFAEAEEGEAPVVAIAATVQDLKVLDAEYDPATGWFRSLTFYDVDPGQDPLEVSWRAKSAGLNYTGPFFQAQASLLLSLDDRVGFSDVPTEGGQPYTDAPEPYHTFTMGEGTLLFGFIDAEAVLGARGLALVDPANSQRTVYAAGAPEGEAVLFLDEPGQAGEWKLTTSGAGGFSGAFAQIYEVTLGEGTMPVAAAAPA